MYQHLKKTLKAAYKYFIMLFLQKTATFSPSTLCLLVANTFKLIDNSEYFFKIMLKFVRTITRIEQSQTRCCLLQVYHQFHLRFLRGDVTFYST